MKLQDLVWTLISAVVLFGILVYLFSGPEEPKQYVPDKSDAYYAAKTFIKDYLKSPRSAEFAPITKASITTVRNTDYDKDVYVVKSYVESMNSFGVMLKTNFVIEVLPKSDGSWIQTKQPILD
jgi:hypothetical protein